jgi:FkbM family methyltransferase
MEICFGDELMKLIRNAKTSIEQPDILLDFIKYNISRWTNGGKAIQSLDGGLKIAGLSGFSEYRSCKNFVNDPEKLFLQNYEFGSGDLIDVGANLGVVSLLLAQRSSQATIHAFEANPSTVDSLRHNITLNQCNIRVNNLAVAGYDGEISFNANPVYRGTTSITKVLDSYTINVPCITLDTYVRQQSIQRVAFLKVDVEGYEEMVFQGAKNLLSQRQIQCIYYEVCPDMAKKAGLSPYAPTQILLDSGYQIYKLSQDGSLTSVKIDEIDRVILDNWIALCP